MIVRLHYVPLDNLDFVLVFFLYLLYETPFQGFFLSQPLIGQFDSLTNTDLYNISRRSFVPMIFLKKFVVEILLCAFLLVAVSCAPSNVIESQRNIESNNVSGYPGPEFRPTETFSEDICHTNDENRIQIRLLKGWRSTPSTKHLSTFLNYPEYIKSDHGFMELPEGSMKIEVLLTPRPDVDDFQQWYRENAFVLSDEEKLDAGMNLDEEIQIPEFEDYQLGKFKGFSYGGIIQYPSNLGNSYLVIVLEVGQEEILKINITPADPSSLEEALQMLSSLQVDDDKACA